MREQKARFRSSLSAARAVASLAGRVASFGWEPEGVLSVLPLPGEEKAVEEVLFREGIRNTFSS